jgi:hypothetical protein
LYERCKSCIDQQGDYVEHWGNKFFLTWIFYFVTDIVRELFKCTVYYTYYSSTTCQTWWEWAIFCV